MSKWHLYGNPEFTDKSICGNCDNRVDGMFMCVCQLNHTSVELLDTCENFEKEL